MHAPVTLRGGADMRIWTRRAALALSILFGFTLGLAQEQNQDQAARIEGRVIKKGTEAGFPDVTVMINELGLIADTDNEGKFVFERVPLGTYNVQLTLG